MEQRIRERVKTELSDKRFRHTEGVVQAATELASRFGVDETKARLAAWIHDVAREWPHEQLVQHAEQVEVPTGFASIPVLLHGPVAACLCSEWFGVDDEDIANAIRFHTTGRLEMSKLERILFLADAIEPGRHYPGVDEIRDAAKHSLTEALVLAMDSSIRYLLDFHQPIFPLTVMARNSLWEEVNHLRAQPS